MLFIPNISKANSDIIVALDPGHGGTEPGASSGGLVEKELTWKIATRVKEILDSTSEITGVLTKNENDTMDRYTRALNAKNNNADLLVSFHINSNEASNNLSGAEVYITHDTTQKRYYEYSNILGLNILSNLRYAGVTSFSPKPRTRVGTPNDVYSNGTVADYYGIISWPMHMDIPSVLVEHCFINNPSDRANYLNDAMLTKMAEADAKAIIDNKELFRREYCGDINTDLKTMQMGTEADGRSYITGEILIAEWINGVACIPKNAPEMTIKSTDGELINGVNLIHNGGLSYSYYRIIDNLDKEKEYYLEAKLTTDKNISTNKTQKVRMADMTIGEYQGTTLKTKNNKLYFSAGGYIGAINTDLKEIQLNQNSNGNYYLSGNMLVAEWIDGVANTPKTLPELTLKSTDNKVNMPISVTYDSGLNYNYSVSIKDLDVSKQYYIEARLTSEDNIGTNKTQKVLLPEKELGSFNDRTIILENNIIKPAYIGAVNTDLKTINLAQNEIGRNYIYGEILIAEWIDGVAYVPDELPEMVIKATDGSFSTGMHVVHNGGLSYTYDRVMDNLDTSKEYEIEVRLVGMNNIGTNKAQIVRLPNKEIGKYDKVRLIAEDNKLKMIDGSLYIGAINTDLKTMNIGIDSIGREYIYGNILIAEWIDGNACIPNGLPEMTLKSTDGSYSMEMYVLHQGGLNYYYDRLIYDLDISKEYYIEVKLTGNKNIGTNKVQNANLNARKNVGEFKDKNLTLEGNKIVFKGNEYIGAINTDLKTMQLAQNEIGRNYIYGEILIAEWIDGVAYIPNKLPEMTIKATDGSFSTGMHVVHNGGLSYTYDRVMDNLDSSKEYEIEVKLTNNNNISNNKVQIAKLENKVIGKYGEIKLIAEDNKLKMENGSLYRGDINTDLKTMYIGINEIGREYIHGNILIAEWIDGVACVPNGLPEMTLKSTDGSYSMGMHVVHEGGLNYYYDRVIYDLDTNKEYYVEVKLNNNNNISNNKVQQANMQPNENVGIFKESAKIVLRDNKMLFEELEARMFTLKIEQENVEEEPEKEIQQEMQKKEEEIEEQKTPEINEDKTEEEEKLNKEETTEGQEQPDKEGIPEEQIQTQKEIKMRKK